MSRWLWWSPLGLLVLSFGLIGLRYGWIAATITETDVINRFATQYVQSHGQAAALTDCMAYPGEPQSGIWLVVSCQPADNDLRYEFYVNRLGGLEYGDQFDAARRTGPKT